MDRLGSEDKDAGGAAGAGRICGRPLTDGGSVVVVEEGYIIDCDIG